MTHPVYDPTPKPWHAPGTFAARTRLQLLQKLDRAKEALFWNRFFFKSNRSLYWACIVDDLQQELDLIP